MYVQNKQLRRAYSKSFFIPKYSHYRAVSQNYINDGSFFLNEPTQNIILHTKNNIDTLLSNLGGSNNLEKEINLNNQNKILVNQNNLFKERNDNYRLKKFYHKIPHVTKKGINNNNNYYKCSGMRNGKNYLQRNLSANHYNKNDILNFVDDSINFTNEKNILNNFDFDQSNFDTTNFGRNDFKNNIEQIDNINYENNKKYIDNKF